MLKLFTILLGNNGIECYKPKWKMLNWRHEKVPKEQQGVEREGKRRERKGKKEKEELEKDKGRVLLPLNSVWGE